VAGVSCGTGPSDQSLLTQTAFFEAEALSGLAYWYLPYPVHVLIFRGLIRQVARHATSR